jgi:hypothetical protein
VGFETYQFLTNTAPFGGRLYDESGTFLKIFEVVNTSDNWLYSNIRGMSFMQCFLLVVHRETCHAMMHWLRLVGSTSIGVQLPVSSSEGL